MSGGLGAGRFMFLHKSLYYSFVHNAGLPRPKFIQFVDPEGNVVEEQEVTLNNYQAETKKICGVWRKMPRIYRKLLKEEKLFAALVTEKIGSDNDRKSATTDFINFPPLSHVRIVKSFLFFPRNCRLPGRKSGKTTLRHD